MKQSKTNINEMFIDNVVNFGSLVFQACILIISYNCTLNHIRGIDFLQSYPIVMKIFAGMMAVSVWLFVVFAVTYSISSSEKMKKFLPKRWQ